MNKDIDTTVILFFNMEVTDNAFGKSKSIMYTFSESSFKQDIAYTIAIKRVLINPIETFFSQFKKDEEWLVFSEIFQGRHIKHSYSNLLEFSPPSSFQITHLTTIDKIEILEINRENIASTIREVIKKVFTNEPLTEWFAINLNNFKLLIKGFLLANNETTNILNLVGFLKTKTPNIMIISSASMKKNRGSTLKNAKFLSQKTPVQTFDANIIDNEKNKPSLHIKYSNDDFEL